MNNSELTDKLGFYYVVFQPTLDDDIIKCWIDGDESFELYSPKELIKFCNILGIDQDVERALKEAFGQTSFWLWDVGERKVRRLSSTYETPTKYIFEPVKGLARDRRNLVDSRYVNFNKDGTVQVIL